MITACRIMAAESYMSFFRKCFYSCSYSGVAAYVLTKSLFIVDLHVLSLTIIEVFLFCTLV